jgi:hypothetical protein
VQIASGLDQSVGKRMGGYSPTAVMETNEVPMVGGDAKSVASARSARSGRSSAVMERAREYNRRIDEVRARSVERGSARSDYGGSEHSNTGPRRSTQSNGGGGNGGRSGVATRERALASVQRESPRHNANGSATAPFSDEKQQQRYGHADTTSPRSIQSTSTYSHRSAGTRGHAQDSQYDTSRENNNSMEALEENDYRNLSSNTHESHDSVGDRGETSGSRRSPQTVSSGKSGHSRPASAAPKSPSKSKASMPPQQKEEQNPDVIVTPELLVDALSGHEDGLLAIAERLMEHYDAGYDVMGEAIIDAFADVQKLFQHVVEAAHMEGAAFEASRREEEMAELRKRAEGSGVPIDATDPLYYGGAPKSPDNDKNNSTPTGPSRHDEFIDQDVRDVMTDAIRKGIPLRNKGSHVECYSLYEGSCNNASSLLPVDSDHRGRLQLSIARAESMSPDRACAILRYAMDDVLRSGLNTTRAILPDPSKRGDCVLDKPTASRSSGSGDLNGNGGKAGGPNGVVQSSEEALASLVEEMKEVMGAPVYDNTPLQAVAKRFWVALGEAQRSGAKNEEKLEQSLGKLKGEFLLARAVRRLRMIFIQTCGKIVHSIFVGKLNYCSIFIFSKCVCGTICDWMPII